MARTFKVSFPLPGRRSSASPNSTPGSQLSANYSDHDGSPVYYPSPKAQEVLGPATPDNVTSSKRQAKKDRKNLRKFPSFMSVTLADLDENESSKAEEGFPFPGMQTPSMVSTINPSQPSRPPSYAMSRHGSSPLLGQNPAIGPTTTQMDYFTLNDSSPRPGLRQATSLSNLRPHHEQGKPLLSVPQPQQTLHPALRDNALLKGEMPITRSLTMKYGSERGHSRNQSGASKDSNGSNTSARTKIAGTPRRRPSVNDPPTLYPNAPKPFTHAVTPPPALINASLPKSMQTGQAPALSFGRPRWWDRRKPKMSPPVEVPEKFEHTPFEDGITSAKVNVKKPKKGISNWFDALDTDESSQSNYTDHETANQRPHDRETVQLQGLGNSMSVHETLAQEASRLPPVVTSRKSSFSTKNKRPGQADRKLSFKLDSSPPMFEPNGEFEQMDNFPRTSMIKSAPGSPTGRNSRVPDIPRGITMQDVDLQIQSVLHLSSSEDEEDTEAESKARKPSYQRHRIRASIERTEYGNEVSLGSALRVQPIKPKPVVSRQSSHSSYRRSQMTSAIPPVPQIPSRPQLTQRTSSMRWQSALEEKSSHSPSQSQNPSITTADATESAVDSAGESSINGTSPSSSQSPPGTRLGISNRSTSSTPLRRGSKLMSVTSEEETLLEAMREKRASIRANDFQKGFNSALQLHVADYMDRPKTSGADGRTSRGSIYGAGSSRGSISPPLLGPTVYRPPGGAYHQQQQRQQQGRHLYPASLGANAGLSASTDNLTLEDTAYPFPEVPSEPIPFPLTIRSPVLKSSSSETAEDSPSLTFSSSDTNTILPGSPSTRNSPLTPPPPPGIPMGSLMMGAYGIVRGGGGSSAFRGQGQLEVKTTLLGAGGGAGGGVGGVGGGGGGGKGYGHERRETGSSSVVMLDGVESYAAKLDEENEISGWAVDSGMDRW